MEAQRRTELIVGIFVVLAIAIVLILVVQMGSSLFVPQYKVTAYFEDAAGLGTGVTVTLAGVRVGGVHSLDLLSPQQVEALGRRGTLVKVVLLIDRKYSIPDGSALVLTKTAILGELQLAIIPTKSRTHLPTDGTALILNTQAPLGPTEKVSRAIDELQVSLQDFLAKFNKIIGDEQFQADLKKSMANIADLSGTSKLLVTNLTGTSAAATDFFAAAHATLESDQVKSIIQRADNLITSLDKSLTPERLTAALDNINGAAQGFDKLAARFNETLEKEHGLLTTLLKDQELGSEVKQTVRELRLSMTELEQLIPRATAAANELRALGEFLRNNPSAILFGRPTDVPPTYIPPSIE